MHRYMKKCPKPYMHIVRANVDGDWEALVRTRPVGRWQETLALLATYTAQVGVGMGMRVPQLITDDGGLGMGG